MLDTVLVDDEFNSLQRLKKIIGKEEKLKIAGFYQNPNKFLTEMKSKKIKIDLIFLDIEMPGINGLLLAEKILNIDENIDVVFVTAYDSYAVEAFELNALDYLLKPISEDRFNKTLNRLFKKTVSVTDPEREKNLHVSCLGKFEIYTDDNQKLDPDWSTSRAEELFLYLFKSRGEFVAKDSIIEDLWPESPVDKAIDILYTTVYNIRKTFKSYGCSGLIKSKRGYYRLNMEKINCDLERLELLFKKYRKGQVKDFSFVKEMISIYKGDFLEKRSYTWVYPLRIKLKKEYKNILNEVVNIYEEKDKNLEAIELLKSLIELDPLDESLHKKLINLYLKEGNKLAARKHYRELTAILQDEFGIEPDFDLDHSQF